MKLGPIAAILLTAAVQTTWMNFWRVEGIAADLMLVVSISIGVNRKFADGAVAGFVAGFIQGTLNGTNMGSYVVSRCLAGALAGYLQPAISRENLLAPSFCVFGVSAAAEIGFFLMTPRFPLSVWALETAGLCLYNALVTPLVHIPLTGLALKAARPQPSRFG